MPLAICYTFFIFLFFFIIHRVLEVADLIFSCGCAMYHVVLQNCRALRITDIKHKTKICLLGPKDLSQLNRIYVAVVSWYRDSAGFSRDEHYNQIFIRKLQIL